jgi:hypothetical protein
MENGLGKKKRLVFICYTVRFDDGGVIVSAKKSEMKSLKDMENHRCCFMGVIELEVIVLFPFLQYVRYLSVFLQEKVSKEILKEWFNLIPPLLMKMAQATQLFRQFYSKPNVLQKFLTGRTLILNHLLYKGKKFILLVQDHGTEDRLFGRKIIIERSLCHADIFRNLIHRYFGITVDGKAMLCGLENTFFFVLCELFVHNRPFDYIG